MKKMAIINDPYVSDDEFDLVEPAGPVSDPSSPSEMPSHETWPPSQHQSAADDRQPSSQHHGDRAVDTAADRLAESSLSESYASASPPAHHPTQDGDAGYAGYAAEGIPGLKYTKSMYQKHVQKYWNSKDLLIAVMGMTGSGKTTFISKVTGRTDLEIGHSLTSCTRDIQVIETKIDGRVVRFVDTPGFSDTTLSDGEVLQLIADYLAAAFRQDMKLSGIIYLHPISDTRVTHHATKNLQMFQKLTGEKNLKNVVLATSMWDKVSEAEGLAREQQLKAQFWRVMMAFSARTARYAGTAGSATDIARLLVGNKPFYLQLQEEMGRDNKALRDTAAGREVMVELARLKEEHRRELDEMDRLLRSSAEEGRAAVDALRAHYGAQLAELERARRDERRMNEDAVKTLEERIRAVENQSRCAVM
ncbi:P-loop containing nucleoside triphosphate hydrolase protein [Xylariaceae sp. FL0804]|nr:P-loop containing nucleoside triphosphate hydrolase protein [Xylariaceae sp. FL0804]